MSAAAAARVLRSNLKHLYPGSSQLGRSLTVATAAETRHECKLLIAGGGSGGIGLAAYFGRQLGAGKVCIVEPNQEHTFQPLWTLVGGGLKQLVDASRPMERCLNENCTWLQDAVDAFHPDDNRVVTKNGKQIKYDFLVVAVGIEPQWDQVDGLATALNTDGVCSIYDARYVEKVYRTVETLQSGNMVFTFPHTPIKCAGAPQKIMFLTDSNLRKMGKRNRFNICYNSALGVMFSVPEYAKTTFSIARERDMTVNYYHKLIAVDSSKRMAIFEVNSNDGKRTTKQYPYDLLHVAPPFATVKCLKECNQLAGEDGYLKIDPHTLQHVAYANVYGIGDCTNLPTSKTLAAITTQGKVIRRRLLPKLLGTAPTSSSDIRYNGYTSCPLITSRNTVVLAEFGYDGKLMETFPLNQNKESRALFQVAANVMPTIYWNLYVKGYWEGPSVFRRLFHPFSG